MSKLVVFLLVLALSTLTLVKSDMNTIRRTCKNTKYFDLCVSALRSDPRSSTADTKGLAAIIAANATATATATAAYLSGELYRSVNGTTVLKNAIKACGEKYSLAADSLRLCAQDLVNEDYDYAYIHVAAAAEYPNSCRNIFRRSKGLVYPADIGRREVDLQRICDVASGIINSLGE